MTSEDVKPQMSLELDKKLTVLQFNPIVEQVLAVGAIDNSLRAIDIQKEKESINLTLSGKITSLEWRQDGGSLVAAQQNGSKRQFIMVDIRQGQGLELEMKGTQAISKLAVCWIGNEELMTIVNEAEQERRMMLWDIRKMEEPLFEEVIDTNPGQTYPFYDNEAKLLYLTSKGQKSILVYEYLNHEFMHLNFSNGAKQYEGTSAGYGYSLLPKALIDQNGDEFNRMLIMQAKQNKEKIVTEISYKQTKFNYLEQFPEYNAAEPSLQKEQWYNGTNSNPIKLSFLNKQKVIPKIKVAQPLQQVQQHQSQEIVTNNKFQICFQVIEKLEEENTIQQEITHPVPVAKENQEDLKQEVNELKNEVKDIKDQIQDLVNTVKYLKEKLEILTSQ